MLVGNNIALVIYGILMAQIIEVNLLAGMIDNHFVMVLVQTNKGVANTLLSFIWILAGAVFGILLHRYVITTVEVDAVMFGRNIKPISFVYSGIITFGFSMFVNMVMHFKLKKINMVESLKSVE